MTHARRKRFWPMPAKGSIAALATTVILSLPTSLVTASGAFFFWPRSALWTGFGPVQPPPSHFLALLPRFHILLHGYLALDGDAKMTFAEWVMAQGIVDPPTVHAMAQLYAWHRSGLLRP